MAKPTMQKASLGALPMETITREGVQGISRATTTVDTVACKRVRFAPGAVTKACPHAHVAYVVSGAIRIRMLNDGSEETYRAGDVMMLPPGHDAWTEGDEPCEFVEFSQGTDGYYHAAG